jgi:hypothetical protein
MEERKQWGMKMMVGLGFLCGCLGFSKRLRWISLKTRTTKYVDPKFRG